MKGFNTSAKFAVNALKAAATVGATIGLYSSLAAAATNNRDLLVKFRDPAAVRNFALSAQSSGISVENIGAGNWAHVQVIAPSSDHQLVNKSLEQIRSNPNVLVVQPNYRVHLLENYQLKNKAARARLVGAVKHREFAGLPNLAAKADNPDIPITGTGGTGGDPLYDKQWGMKDIGAQQAWATARGKGIVVAVIDTGVDYTHEDLVDSMWHNPGETGKDAQGRDKATNGVDDDGNGFIDDTIGWDFVTNDNKPYDLSVDPIQILLGGGNPGHGTHCAGNVAGHADNGKGIGGVAPDAKIMAIRFLSEKGEGSTAEAIKAINYAVKNGAKVLSNSWGSEGEDPAEDAQNKALREAVQMAQDAGVLFVAAAGNGHTGVGYDNDSDAKPGYPASYDHDNIISVAAIDAKDALGAFSNWGAKTVDIAAPGVAVFSTTVGSNYSDTVIDILGIKATWDGTSMAAPHVSGAAALYWSKHPEANWKDVKNAILASAKPVAALSGKMVSGGKLNVENLASH